MAGCKCVYVVIQRHPQTVKHATDHVLKVTAGDVTRQETPHPQLALGMPRPHCQWDSPGLEPKFRDQYDLPFLPRSYRKIYNIIHTVNVEIFALYIFLSNSRLLNLHENMYTMKILL